MNSSVEESGLAQKRSTVCNRDCPDACAIVATVENGRVTRLAGDKDHPVTRGFLCYRTGRFLERQYSPDRLTAPLIRNGNDFRPVGWEEALDFAASRLAHIRAESGPASIFHYRSGGSLGVLKLLTEYFFEQWGPVTIKRGDICSGAGDAAQMEDFGEEDSHDLFDLLNARNIILWGKNAVTSSPHTVPVLREARKRGAGLVLIDPVFHKTAHLCEEYHQIRPGGDFALAMAVARILLDQGWIDPEAPSYCDHFDAFAAMARARTVDDWCREADLSPAVARGLAQRLGPGKPTAILVGWGMGRRSNGAAIVRALDALGAISGNLGIEGGGVSFYFKRRGAFDTSFIRGAAAAPRTVCEPLMGSQILEMRDPPVRAVWVTCGNPVVMLPDSERIVQALASRELVVVVDSFLTDTARQAHLVLPTTTLLEDDDLLGAYGHHWIGASRPVVERPGGVRTDLEIMQGLARRLGLGGVMAGDATSWKRRLMGPRLAPHGITLESLEERPIRNPLAEKVLFAGRKFPTATGRVNLIHAPPPASPLALDPAIARAGRVAATERPHTHAQLAPTPVDDAGSPHDAVEHAGVREAHSLPFPLLLMAISTQKAQSSQWAREPAQGDGPAEIVVHPDSAAGCADGALATLESAIGRMTVRVRHDACQRRDVALTTKGGHRAAGRCSNGLVRARLTDMGEGGALYEERVRLVPPPRG